MWYQINPLNSGKQHLQIKGAVFPMKSQKPNSKSPQSEEGASNREASASPGTESCGLCPSPSSRLQPVSSTTDTKWCSRGHCQAHTHLLTLCGQPASPKSSMPGLPDEKRSSSRIRQRQVPHLTDKERSAASLPRDSFGS